MMADVRELMEQDAILQFREASDYLRRHQAHSAAYYLSFLAAFTCAVAVVMTASVIAERHFQYSGAILFFGALVAAAIVFLSEAARNRPAFLERMTSRLSHWASKFRQRSEGDFLARHYWTSWVLIWTPLLLGSLIMGLGRGSWVSPADKNFAPSKEIITQLVRLLAGLLGAQLTLFTFLVGTALGRHSASLAQAVIWHRAIRSVVGFVMTALACLVAGLVWGYPSGFAEWTSLIGVLTFFATLISVWITFSGMSSERALIYAGLRFALMVRKSMRPPLTPEELRRPTLLWWCLTNAGLDFRDPDRFSPMTLPRKGVNRTRGYIMALLNAAHQAIRDGQQENLHGCLASIAQVVQAYTEGRKGYVLADDPVFRYLNDQIAGLMRVAASNTNESLLTSVISTAGAIAKLSMNVGRYPHADQTYEMNPQATMLPVYWIGLLEEGFEMGFNLKRSSAASEVLLRLHNLAIEACREGYVELVTLNFLHSIEGLHRRCLAQFDAYRGLLAGECLRRVVSVWAFSALREDRWHTGYQVYDATVKRVRQMAICGFAVQKMTKMMTHDFSDVGSVLTAKLTSDAILQDVFFFALHRKLTERWQFNETAKDLVALLALLAELGVTAAKEEVVYADGFCMALYECGYLVLERWPATFDWSRLEPERGPLDDTIEPRPQPRVRVTAGLLQPVTTLLNAFYRSDSRAHLGSGWEDSLVGLLGIAMLHYQKQPHPLVKERLVAVVRSFLALARAQESSGGYHLERILEHLRLIGAWTDCFMDDPGLVQELVSFLASHPPARDSYGVSAGLYGGLGYPTNMHGDFALPYPRNLRPQKIVTEQDDLVLARLQEALVCDAVLVSFYRKIVPEEV